jgi:hypothetical protein
VGCYAVSTGKYLLTFRKNIVQQPKEMYFFIGLLRPEEGHITFCRNVRHISPVDKTSLLRHGRICCNPTARTSDCSYVLLIFETLTLLKWLNVLQIIELGSELCQIDGHKGITN